MDFIYHEKEDQEISGVLSDVHIGPEPLQVQDEQWAVK